MSTPKVPRFCCSHTVRGTATIRIMSAAESSKTIAEGVYWTDPVYVVADAVPVDLFYVVKNTINDAAFLVPYLLADLATYGPDTYAGLKCELFQANAAAIGKYYKASASQNTSEGRRLLHRLGLSQVIDSATTTGGGLSIVSNAVPGIWAPAGRGISSRRLERRGAGQSAVSGAHGYGVSAFRNGDPLTFANIVIEGLQERWVYSRGQVSVGSKETVVNAFADAEIDASVERLLWDVLQRGEMVRYYEDASAATSHLTVAVAISDTTITLADTTGFANGDMVWVDGEPMRCEGVTSGTVLAVDRQFPTTHPNYAPAANAFVATYTLDQQGNMGLESFVAPSRGYYQDRYDIALPLRRAVWQG
jgi:hypothetical protein